MSGRDPNHRRLYADVAEKYAGWVRHANSSDAPDANAVYRRTLAAQTDGSVVVCSVGFLTNLRRLIETPPDDISPLDGKALVARKVARCVIMACKHPRGKEYNSKSDPESSRIALDEWPTPIVFVDFDFGRDCFAGRALAETAGGDNPVRDVFAKNLPGREEVARDPEGWGRKCYGMGGRSAWDEVAALVAVMGAAPRFGTERGTYRMVSADGENEWVPADGGENMRIVEREPKAEVGRVIDELMLRPPALRTGEARP